jgi:hypothetical protein
VIEQDDPASRDTNARLAARLQQLLNTPGISDKDRKLVEQNLKRLIAATSGGHAFTGV